MMMSEMPFFVFTMLTCSVASWLASLSPVTSRQSQPRASACAAMDPKMSSPSQPGIFTTGMPRAVSTSSMTGNCSRSSWSIGGRWALYFSISSRRNFGFPTSNAQKMASGLAVSMNLNSIDKNPNTAFVCVPSGAFMVGGTAW